MKKLIVLLSIMFVFVAAQAQTTRTLTAIKGGLTQSFNLTYADTIESGETLNFILTVNHTEQTAVSIQQFAKVVAADTTIVLTIYESMDGTNWTRFQYNNSGAQADYAALTVAKGAVNISYTPDVAGCYLRGRYIKLAYVASTKSGFKKIVSGYIKTANL